MTDLLRSIFPSMVVIDSRRHKVGPVTITVDGRDQQKVLSVIALWNGGPGIVRKAWAPRGLVTVSDYGGTIVDHYVAGWRVRVTPKP